MVTLEGTDQRPYLAKAMQSVIMYQGRWAFDDITTQSIRRCYVYPQELYDVVTTGNSGSMQKILII